MPVMPVMAVALLVSGAIAALGYRQVLAIHGEVEQRTAVEDGRSRRGEARARFDVRRRALASAIREEVRLAHPEIGPPRLRELIDIVVRAAERYPSVDPVLFASIGIVDSRDASEPMADGGIYRLSPDAARELAEELGWEYDEALRSDPVRTAELAARHLDGLNRAYNDVEMMLAEYNGGPLNAGYLRAEVGRLSKDTERYIPEVLDVYRRLASRLSSGANGEPAPIDVRRARTLAEAAGGA